MSPDDLAPAIDLYDADFYAWTQAQAAALRAAASTSTLIGLEWDRLAEEIEDVGNSQYFACRSFVTRIIEHLFKLSWSQREDPKAGWRAEIVRFRVELDAQLTATLRAKLKGELERLHVNGAKLAQASFAAHEPGAPVDTAVRWTFEQILGESDDPIASAR